MSAADDAAPVSAAEAKTLFDPLASATALVLAVSGGPDSTALLLQGMSGSLERISACEVPLTATAVTAAAVLTSRLVVVENEPMAFCVSCVNVCQCACQKIELAVRE